MSIEEENKDIIRRLVQGFNEKSSTVLDELVDVDCIDHVPFPGQRSGLDGIKQSHDYFYEGFPDIHETIDDIVAEGDKVVIRYTLEGTHTGMFISVPIPPTGIHASVQGFDIYRISNHKIVENWHVIDALGLLFQLGVYR